MTNNSKLSEHYAVLDLSTRNVESLVTFSGIATSPSYYNLSDEDYNKVRDYLFTKGLGVNITEDGMISSYDVPPPPQPPLKFLAEASLSDVQSEAPMIVAMGGSFGPKTKTYVESLQAIINGTDTTSTTLPDKPDNFKE